MLTAPLLQVLNANGDKTFTDVKKAHFDAMEHKIDLIGEDSKHASVILWSAENAFKAQLAAGEFQDKQRHLARRVKQDRQFEVVEAPTRVSLETSGKAISDAKAVLIINGTVTTGGTPTEFFNEALAADEGGAAMGQTFGSIPGVIGKIFLQGTNGNEAKIVGGCYLFVDEQSMLDYLAGDIWAKAQAETPWENVKIEKFVVSAGPAAPAC